jgi:DNA-binding MarR family transcriptional regulator
MAKSLQVLLRDAHMTVDAEVQTALAAAGYVLTPGHYRVLRNLGEDGARPVELAAKASITRQAIAKIVVELERIGMVRREPTPDDRRGVIVRYTDHGLAGLAVARKRMAELEHEYTRRLGAKRWAALRATLEELFGEE